ncbi:MAG: hypothetical protein ACPGWS_09700 [Solirubrobacterales bacterium]
MAAIHGRNGRLFVDVAATAAAEGAANAVEIPFLADYSIEQARDRVEVTSFGDSTKTYVAGLADASGSLNGFLNDSSLDLYTVADGSARSFYLYVDASSAGTKAPVDSSGAGYWYGLATFDVSSTSGVGDAAKTTINWSASTSVTRL